MDGEPSFRFDWRNSLPEQWLRNKAGGAYSTLLHLQRIKLDGKTSWMTNNRDVFDNTLGDFDKWTTKPFDRLKISRHSEFFCGFSDPGDESSMNRSGRRLRWDYFANFFVEFNWDNEASTQLLEEAECLRKEFDRQGYIIQKDGGETEAVQSEGSDNPAQKSKDERGISFLQLGEGEDSGGEQSESESSSSSSGSSSSENSQAKHKAAQPEIL